VSIPVVAAVGPSAYWYLTRGTGAVALVLLTASVVLGIAGSQRITAVGWPRFAVEVVHRDISLLAIALLVVHIATSSLDSFAPISVTAGVIPFISSYRPFWLGLGALSFDLLLAVAITSLVRRRLGYTTWRAVHWLAYVSWPIAVLHGLGTGSDTKVWWMLALTAACLAAVVSAIWWRAGALRPELRGPVVAATLAAPVALFAFTVLGPLQTGWAKRAGTPAKLLASAHPVAVPHTTPSAYRPRPFSALLDGSIRQSQVPAGAILDLDMHMRGGAHGQLRVRLGGSPIAGGGLSLTGSQVDLLADGMPSAMQGEVSALEGGHLVAHVRGASGPALKLDLRLRVDEGANSVTGDLTATPAPR
jgi:DMSO/TMAO reductase YedYZ heme-binding membrane subunit